MKHYAWFINKKRFFALIRFGVPCELISLLRSSQITRQERSKRLCYQKKKKLLKVKSEELTSLLGYCQLYCHEKKYSRNYQVNLRNILIISAHARIFLFSFFFTQQCSTNQFFMLHQPLKSHANINSCSLIQLGKNWRRR